MTPLHDILKIYEMHELFVVPIIVKSKFSILAKRLNGRQMVKI